MADRWWFPLGDWMADHEKWVTIPCLLALGMLYGGVAVILCVLVMHAVGFSTMRQCAIWADNG